MYNIEIDNEPADWEKIIPNFIHNRFDLKFGRDEKCLLLRFYNAQGGDIYIPVYMRAYEADIGCWLSVIKDSEFRAVSKFIFSKYKKINCINICRAIVPNANMKTHNDFHVELPNTIDELDRRLSKKGRYNIRREKKNAEKMFGTCSVINIKSTDEKADEFIKCFFRYKKITHHVNYTEAPAEYIRQNYITDIYALQFGKLNAAVIVSSEQTPTVFCENMAYDISFKGYSPGTLLYEAYLKKLVEKGKKAIFLLGGNNDYKKRWGGVEKQVVDYKIFRSPFYEMTWTIKNKIPVKIWSLLPNKMKHFVRKIGNKTGMFTFSSSE